MPGTGPGHDNRVRQRRLAWVLAIVLVLVHAGLAWLSRPSAVATGNDDALYLLLGRSLRSLHYLDAHIVGTPIHSQYPPGYPAFIALVWSITGEHFDMVLLGGILVSAIGLLITFDLGQRSIGLPAALFLLAALALNPGLIEFAGSPRSETLYMTTTLAAIWCVSRGPPTTRWMVAAGALAIYAAMVRSIGVALVVAVSLVWLSERRYRAASLFTAAAAVVVGGWLLWTTRAPEKFASRSYVDAIQPGHARPTQSGPVMVFIRRTEAAVRNYGLRSIPVALSAPTIEGTSIDNLFWVGVIGVGLASGLLVFLRGYRVVPAFMLLYGAILAVWPFDLTRFVIPVLPLILLTMAAGLVALVRRLGPRAEVAVVAILCVPLTISGARRDMSGIEHARLCRPQPHASPECSTEDQRSFFAAANYARVETSRDAKFLTVKEATFAYLTGRQVQHPALALLRDSLNVPAILRRSGVDYVLVSPLYPSRLGDFLLPRCTELTLLRAFPPDTYLFRVLPSGDSTQEASCQALAKVVANPKFSRHCNGAVGACTE